MMVNSTMPQARNLPASPAQYNAKINKKRSTKVSKKRKDAAENAPIFLRKTYHMIDTCDPNVATWSDDGSAFVVKDTDRFASDIIGQFFKHNNFSSFVRQLNFYGFRKIKSDPLRIRDAEEDIESKYWKFRHEKFQRGKPHLLVEIRKTNQAETAEKQEVDSLRKEVQVLKSKLLNMTGDMERLASMVKNMTQAKESCHDSSSYATTAGAPQQGATKKRRVSPLVPNLVHSLSKPVPSVASSYGGTVPSFGGVTPPPPIPPPMPVGPREESNFSLTSVDEDILASLFDTEEPSDEMNDIAPVSLLGDMPDLSKSGDILRKENSDVDMNLVNKLKDSLSRLPKNMQEVFVERMVAAITNPEAFKKQVDAVSELASTAAEETKKRYGDDIEICPEAVELASAVMASFLSRHSTTTSAPGAPEHDNRSDSPLLPLIEL